MSRTASTYAQALFDVALEENILESVKDDLNAIRVVIEEQPEFMEILTLPKLDKTNKKELVKSIFENKTSKILVNFLMLLIDKERINLLPEIMMFYNELVNKHFGILEGTVYCAVPVNEGQLTELTYAFTKKLNQKVKLNVEIDPSLLGGYRVNLGDVVYDNSIKLQLKNLKNNLLNVELK